MSSTPRTIIVGITPGQSTASYTLAPDLLQYVEAVYIEVDNTAGADTRPTLTVKEQAGVVIAKKRQAESIPAAGAGSATWALRLTDEGGGSATGFIRYDFDNTGNWLHISASSHEGITTDGVAFDVTENFRVDAANFVVNTPGAFGNVLVTSGNTIGLTANGNVNIAATTGAINENAATIQGGADTWQFNIGTGGYTLVSVGDVFVQASGANRSVFLKIPTGGTMEVLNHLGQTIFKVDEAGDLHGKTGKSLVFDL